MLTEIDQLQVTRARSAAVIAHFCDELDVVGHINRGVTWDPIRSEMSPGEAIKAMVINLLVKREPLYRIEAFYEEMDIPMLFDRPWLASDFNDDRLGRHLEKLAKGDLPKIYHSIAFEALVKEGITLDQSHVDTTSLSVHGAYDHSVLEGSHLEIDRGHSKARRPDLNQFKFGLGSVGGLPLFADVMAGHTSDKTWNRDFALRMGDLLPKEALQTMITVADSALVNKKTLKAYGDRPFISRLPETFNLCQDLKDIAFAHPKNWQEVGALRDHKKAATYQVQGIDAKLYEKTYRFVVVHSSQLDLRKQKKLDRDISKEQTHLEKKIAAWHKKRYHCEQDAVQALTEHVSTKRHYHHLTGKVRKIEQPKRRPGRPSKTKPVPIETFYVCECELQPDTERIDIARQQASTFVLISNVSKDREPESVGLLRRYKAQIDVENLFRALKHPYFVHGVFLKNDSRVLGLSYVFVIGLLLYALLQRRVRHKIAEEQKPLKLYGKAFDRPTGKTILEQFDHVLVVELEDPDTQKLRKFVKISDTAKQILRWLGLDETLYTEQRQSG